MYEELRKFAAQWMAKDVAGQTIQATALVHEAYLRLVGSDDGQACQWDSVGHYFAAADGQTLISADDKAMIQFWNLRSDDASVLRGHQSDVYPVLLSPDGATPYSGGWDGFVGRPG